VEDSGDGIADEVADNLFDPYVTTKTTGSGLGLAIVKKIVDEHNGVVWVEKGSKGGARFIIRLPAISASSDDMAGTEDATSSVEIVP
jgi:signal transduction histidine kinase